MSKGPSTLEIQMSFQIAAAHLPEAVTEFAAIHGRKFRFDYAWPRHNLLLEIQGSTWVKGGHSTGTGIARDCEKGNLATLAGWKVLHVTGDQIKSGQALKWLQKFFECSP